ncbi:TetR/AcrR family transcriptional regulator [Tomitella fengzijianii]|uniref:TetR/AcrR family transcriptional regulator n=1 Tax=Tomitella fengzijianii TaxID=2597660 RepID=A0A516X706_9ACTN|nr:TetR/AcrR family transcriptional regulator [Tomitella fengzijianii]QDQ98859.1 TetR/AcrR family transcriptional regulator [Tomitella fengzijianii]
MARRRGWGGAPPASDEEAAERIVSAAVALITETGAGITIADVAERLGVIRQTVYRYFPSADALMRAAAIASVDGFLDRLAAHVDGLTDPAGAMVEAVLFTLEDVHRIPHLGLMLSGGQAQGVTAPEAIEFGMTMIRRFDVDWEAHGYDDAALRELVEFVLRTMQSFFLSPADPVGGRTALRSYLDRWMGTAIAAQARITPAR